MARLVREYLEGRLRGELDVSGRAAASAKGQAVAVEAPTLVIDDPQIAGLVAELGIPTYLYGDSVACTAPDGVSEVDSLGELPQVSRVVVAAPKSRAGLREYLVAAPGAEVVVAGRDKHLPAGLRADMQAAYEHVDMAPGAYKSRLFVGQGFQGAPWRFPQVARRGVGLRGEVGGVAEREVDVYAHALCFGGTAVDAGSRLLFDVVVRGAAGEAGWPVPGTGATIVDLGCGNGWLAAALAIALRPARVVATDVSKAAVSSARRTLAGAAAGAGGAAGVGEGLATGEGLAGCEVVVDLSDAGAGVPAASADLVVLNPPFHEGAAISTDTAHRLIRAAWRIVRPGGHVVVVFNSHLHYRGFMERVCGKVRQLARDRRFTVLAAHKPAHPNS